MDWVVTQHAATAMAGDAAATVTRKPTATAIPTRAAIPTGAAIATSAAIATVAKKGATALPARATGATSAPTAGGKGSALSGQEQTSGKDAGGEQNADAPFDVVLHENLRRLIL